MRFRTILVTTAVVVVVFAGPARTQQIRPSRTPRASDATATAALRSRHVVSRRRSLQTEFPPPPPIPRRSSRSSQSRVAGPEMVGIDSYGRRDQAGHPVGFYPSVRGQIPTGIRSAMPSASSGGAPRENPQKKAYTY